MSQGRDTLPPYASGAARLGLLYRLALDALEARVLVVGARPDRCAAILSGNPAARLDVMTCGAASEPGVYDAVFMPDLSLPVEGGSADAAGAPLRTARAALRPGGVLAGHMEQLRSLRGAVDALRTGTWPIDWWRQSKWASPSRLRRALEGSGFAEVECYYVEPSIDAPTVLVPDHPAAAREHFLRAVRRTRGQYRWPGYAARLLLAQTRLGGQMQRDIYFRARRPC